MTELPSGSMRPLQVFMVELEVAVLALLERGRDLGDADLEVEAGLGRHRLHDLGDGAGLRACWPTMKSIGSRPVTPASFISALALARSRLGIGNFC